ncbi:MAG: hypothetical protein V1792_07605 [Pseudomonadota bacterium]
MISGVELDLLMDLGKLLKKYGPQPFRVLATWLSSPDKTEELVTFLSHTADISSKVHAKKSVRKSAEKSEILARENIPKAKASTPKALKSLQVTEPEKHEILVEFHARLLRKSILPELKDIRHFAVANGLKDLKGDSRQKAINPLVNALAGLPIHRVREAVQARKRERGYNAPREDSLEDWTEVILGGGRKSRAKLQKLHK